MASALEQQAAEGKRKLMLSTVQVEAGRQGDGEGDAASAQQVGVVSSAPGQTILAADFLSPHFDVKRWVSAAILSGIGSETDGREEKSGTAVGRTTALEDRVARILSATLRLSEKTAGELEALSEQVVKSAPRMLLDLESLRIEAAVTRERVRAVQCELEERERHTGPAFRYLRDLDLVKSRMEAARSSLREAQNWSNLADEVDSILGSGEAGKAASRLAEARKSLVVFANTPEYGDRKALLRTLQNQLAQSLIPQVVVCLRDHDTETYRRFAAIFDQIEKPQEFEQLHFRFREQHMLERWKAVATVHQEQLAQYRSRQGQTETSKSSLETEVTAFVDELFVVIGEEVAWCRAIGMDPLRFVTEFNSILFNDMTPSLGSILRDVAQEYGDANFIQLVHLFEVFEGLGNNVERLLISPATVPVSVVDTSPGASKSLSTVYRWGGIIYEPFLPYQLAYDYWERRTLEKHIQRHLGKLLHILSDRTVSCAPMEVAHHLTSKLVPNVFAAILEAINRCLLFTKGLAAMQLVIVVDEFANDVVRMLEDVIGRFRAECGVESRPSGTETGKMADFEDEKEVGDAENWANFQVGLRLVGLSLLLQRKLDYVINLLRGPSFREARRVVDLALDIDLNSGNGQLDQFFARLFELPSPAMPGTTYQMTSSSNGNHTNFENKGSEAQKSDWDDASEVMSGQTLKCQAALAVLVQSDLLSKSVSSFFSDVFTSSPTARDRSSPERRPLSKARSSNRLLTAKAQLFVFDTTLAPIVKSLTALPRLPAWKQLDDRSTTMSPLNLEIPHFSLSPSPYVTRLGEHLLMLPQHFEPYADDEGLKFSVNTIPHYHPTTEEEGAGDETHQPVGPISTEEVTHTWLTSIARGAMSLLLSRVLQIPLLTPSGARQLSTDLGYLFNVLRALEIRPTPLLVAIKVFCEMREPDLAAELGRRMSHIASAGGSKSEDDAACEIVAAMRRVNV